MKKNIGWYAAGLLALAMVAHAGIIIYNAPLVTETALAYSTTYPFDLQSNGISALSAQATYSSATVASTSFTDGSQSTGSFTILSFAGLIAAPAVNHITVVTNTGLTGALITLPGYTFREGIDWKAQSTTSGTAASIKAALAAVPYLATSRGAGSSVVYATATVGSYYNSVGMVSSTPTALTIFTPTFTGGQDNARLSINGVILQQGRDFTASVSNATTATSLKNAINANTLLHSWLSAGASGALVTSTSTLTGAKWNFATTSSSPTAASASGAAMTGGTTAADTLGSATIHKVAHGLTTALPVLYSASAGGSIGGLTGETTYYAIKVGADDLKLASSSANALLGTGITVTSTQTQITAHTFTLAPLSITGNPSFKWQVSNDNSFWIDLAVSSVTVAPYTNPATNTLWSFGYIGTRYVRLNVLGPTTGAISLNVRLIGTN